MKYILSVLTAFILLGCSDAADNRTSKQEALKTEGPAAAQTKPATNEEAVKEAEVPSIAAVVTVADGKALFQRCIACHGSKAEKQALGKSQVIATWDAARIASALKGYRDGGYGGAMKALMEGQVKAYSDADIEAVAEYIKSL